MRELLIVAGFGCRRGVSAEAVVAAFAAALRGARRASAEIGLLAAPDLKADEAGLADAARRIGRPLVFIDRAGLARVVPGTQTRSAAAEAVLGVPSAAEASALAAAGAGARLIGPRIVLGQVTCALAVGGGPVDLAGETR